MISLIHTAKGGRLASVGRIDAFARYIDVLLNTLRVAFSSLHVAAIWWLTWLVGYVLYLLPMTSGLPLYVLAGAVRNR